MKYTIEPVKGILHIMSEWSPCTFTPAEGRNGWTTGLKAEDYPDLCGRSAEPRGDVWRIVTATGLIRFVDTGGPNVRSQHYEERRVLKPNRRGKWLWKHGRWTR